MTIDIVFVGIDYWNRPVYKVVNKDLFIGSVDVLLPDVRIAPNGTVEEINEYFRNNLDQLVLFGSTFDEDHDPLGYKIKNTVELNIIQNE